MMAVEQRRGLHWALLVLTGSALLSTGACAQIKRPEGGEVTMEVRFDGDPSEINWKKDGNKVVDMELKPLDIHYYHVHGRAIISPTNGSLTIRNLTVGDSGHYMAEALVNNIIQETPYQLTVIACPTKPTISNITTENQTKLSCESKTPGVTYEWRNQTRLVAQSASYTATRTREGGNLTCVVYVDKAMCKNEASIPIPPIPGPGRSRGGLIAAPIVVVVPALAAALLVYLYRNKNHKSESQLAKKQDEENPLIPTENHKSESQPEGKQDEENPLISTGSKQSDAEQGGHQVAKRAAEQNTPEDRKSGSQPEEEQAENQDSTVPWNTPESPRSGSQPAEEQAENQDFTEPRNTPEDRKSGSQPEEEQAENQDTTVPRNTPESHRSGSQPKEEGVADKVVQKVADQALTAARNTPGHPANESIGNITLHPIELTEEAGVTWMKNDQQLDIEDGRIQLHTNGDLTINNVTSAGSTPSAITIRNENRSSILHSEAGSTSHDGSDISAL